MPDPVEDAFRSDLLRLALEEDWASWRTARLVFADWLEEHDRPEHALARAEWRCVWTKTTVPRLVPFVYLFEVATPRPSRGGTGRENGGQLLCFQPGSLRLLRHCNYRMLSGPNARPNFAVQFSWVPKRQLDRYGRSRLDSRPPKHPPGSKAAARTTYWPNGFPDLWLEPGRPKRSEPDLFSMHR